MRFVDSCQLKIVAGNGGNGCVAFRREKYQPHGGPSGGDGGKGGDVILHADPGMSTLLDLTYQHTLKAEPGEPGRGKDQYGRGAEPLVVRVPVGTQVFDKATGSVLFDITEPNSDTVVAHGGKGGRGNIHFATSWDRAPRRAEPGEPGGGKDQYGRGAEPHVVRVPVGTQVFDKATGNLLFDITKPDSDTVVAHGGKGGRGNIHFATSWDRAPRRAEPGEPGEELEVRFELKVMADVGLLGFPNAGKSTFIRAVSRARPKVADYPFTTLVPHLGVVVVDDHNFVVADIPGLIPGASEGAGLGIQFLKHVERTRALLHLISIDPGEGRDPMKDYLALRAELKKFSAALAKRPEIVALSKADLPEVRDAYPALKKAFAKKKIPLFLVSAPTTKGVRDVLRALYKKIER